MASQNLRDVTSELLFSWFEVLIQMDSILLGQGFVQVTICSGNIGVNKASNEQYKHLHVDDIGPFRGFAGICTSAH